MSAGSYQAKQFNLSNLKGISDQCRAYSDPGGQHSPDGPADRTADVPRHPLRVSGFPNRTPYYAWRQTSTR